MSPPSSLLLVRLSSIGDVIHTLPVYQALRAAWPDTRLGWAVESAAADLLRPLSGLRVHELPIQTWRRRPVHLNTWRQIVAGWREIRAQRYELVLELQGLIKSAVIARASGAEVVGFHPRDLREPAARLLYHRCAVPAGASVHVLQRNLALLRSLGIEIPPKPRFPALVTESDRAYIDRQLSEMGCSRFLLVHAAANWPSKRYPTQRWVEMARRVRAAAGVDILWVWGPGEQRDVAVMAAAAGPGNRPAPPTRLPALAALMQRAAAFVGGDSGPLHLAVACNVPVVALFGPTDPARLGPIDPADTIVCRVLSCSHCHRRRCPLGTRECLEAIPAAELAEAVIARLADAERSSGVRE